MNRQLHDQFVMEFLEFSKRLEFHGRTLRKQVAGHYGVLTLRVSVRVIVFEGDSRGIRRRDAGGI
jgi:hypothetical protein